MRARSLEMSSRVCCGGSRAMRKVSDDVRRDQEETAREDNKWYEQRLLLVNGRWKLCSNRKRIFREVWGFGPDEAVDY